MQPTNYLIFLAGAGELVGCVLFSTGIWLPIGAALIIMTMLVAIIKVHGKNGLWITKGGIEYNLILLGSSVALILTGPGQYVA